MTRKSIISIPKQICEYFFNASLRRVNALYNLTHIVIIFDQKSQLTTTFFPWPNCNCVGVNEEGNPQYGRIHHGACMYGHNLFSNDQEINSSEMKKKKFTSDLYTGIIK